jgi:hypothetical protein
MTKHYSDAWINAAVLGTFAARQKLRAEERLTPPTTECVDVGKYWKINKYRNENKVRQLSTVAG